ncbi:TIGR04255 family protein [Laribacter hongkongensis]|uniref:TIGR04255 family protein n=1 Tax=Laribacter hongkongensis TaxID=168471 RepID=A0ABD4SU58_9NEIS|nr:TIGR04255 family protein [Laribacter hongkongensis]MCG9027009.1 TIGR04255 family protein [Laribacter hongkongensis]MCG9104327.1 TIGR04255 family protein [Laribacter hongkongensis]MCG9114132.1 TIGR04255 family protein [Laribacter hongkongensis]
MSASRENAPLVELVAELRWNPSVEPSEQMTGGPSLTFIAAHSSAPESFFMRFAGLAHSLGHTDQERVVPLGFPMLAHQTVHRFKRQEEGSVRSLYQVGPGIFSANAVPPYESWHKKFEQVVHQGVEALLKSRPEAEADAIFTGLSLRYIDAFNASHTGGRDIESFLKDVFKISVDVPHAWSQHLYPESKIKPMIQLQIPMKDGFVMQVGIGEGIVNSQPAILLDTSVSATLPVPAKLDAVMTSFNLAHDAIAATFEELIQPIEHLIPKKPEV